MASTVREGCRKQRARPPITTYLERCFDNHHYMMETGQPHADHGRRTDPALLDEAICQNIASLANQRALLSQNLLAQLRDLVEGVAVRLHMGKDDAEFNYAAIDPGLAFIKTRAKLKLSWQVPQAHPDQCLPLHLWMATPRSG